MRVPSRRPPGWDWLNGPLVWAIDDWHQPMYLFPRDCPRILAWPRPATSQADLDSYWTPPPGRMVAYLERAWQARLQSAVIYRYELPPETFTSLDDTGMWVSVAAVAPIGRETLTGLDRALGESGVALRVVDRLAPLRGLWATSLHVSGIRLRNAQDWS